MVELDEVGFTAGRKKLLNHVSFSFPESRCLVITGSNGSGKSLLGLLLARKVEPTTGRISLCGSCGYVSFERQKALLDEERRRDGSRYFDGSGAETAGRTLYDWIDEELTEYNADYLAELVGRLKLGGADKRGLRYLSSGEFRKAMVCRMLVGEPDILIFDDPYDGLDRESKAVLKTMVEALIREGKKVIFISGRREDFPHLADSMVILDKGILLFRGSFTGGMEKWTGLNRTHRDSSVLPYRPPSGTASPIVMRDVRVQYGENIVFDHLNWTVERGENWLITGPNGAGKSTLLSLISGDNPKAFGQDITLFGRKKGSGESVWEIKKRLGHVSGELQMNFRVRSSLLEAVLTGLFDTIGLYDKVKENQIALAREWISLAGLGALERTPFPELSFGEKRMALILRALIKSPELLILDEPCQGLDEKHRNRVVQFCDRIGAMEELTMIYVTHSDYNVPRCLNRHLELG